MSFLRIVSFQNIFISFAMVIALCAIIGWQYNVPRLYSFNLENAKMMTSTSFLILLLGVSILAENFSVFNLRIFYALNIVVNTLALLIFLKHAFYEFPFLDVFSSTSPQSAAVIWLTSLATWLRDTKENKGLAISQSLLIIGFLFVYFVICGHLYKAASLYHFSDNVGMSLNTATALFFLILGIFFKRPLLGIAKNFARSGPIGLVLKRFTVASFIFPMLSAALLIYGRDKGWYGAGESASFYVLVIASAFAIMSWFTARYAASLEDRTTELSMQRQRGAELESEVRGLEYYQNQLQRLTRKIIQTQEDERKKVSREIHDEFGQSLSALKMDLNDFAQAKELPKDAFDQKIEVMKKSIDQSIVTIRRIARDLRPSILDDLGLIDALQWLLEDFEERSGIECSFFVESENSVYDKEAAVVAFRVLQESLTNITRHSQANKIHVTLEFDTDYFELRIQDNGNGFNMDDVSHLKSVGILGMKERAALLEGVVEVSSHLGIGTKVMLKLPLKYMALK